MTIAFDLLKDALSTVKHGISLAKAADIEWDAAIFWQDERHGYGEVRMCAIAYIGVRLHFIVYVDRDDVRRFISLR
jgi:uncharacterized DUF497 family protein